ncbi:hypothetical protein AA14337_2477 [Acetobacter malorum DSM 14337]|uniref:Uncharacterized protein n=1 Tax=Acetobacter malorum DSM 14337 TaxID=1307910 RepID=A0ABQ0PVY1_9PROT|nr:hypothetical protein AA14337_2477 [Acetobacter malorum DSM 14337]
MKTLPPCPADALQTRRRHELWTKSSLFARPNANGAEDFPPPRSELMQTGTPPLTPPRPALRGAGHPTGG